MASVRKRPWAYNGTIKEKWVVEYTDAAGKRRRHTPKSGLKKDAEKVRQRVEAEIEAGVHTPQRETMTLREAADAYLRDCDRRCKVGDISGASFARYKADVAMIVSRIGAKRLPDITSLTVQDTIDDLTRTYSRRTVKGFALVLRQVLAFAVRRKWLKRNLMVDEPPRLPRVVQNRVRVPSIEDLRAILQSVAKHRPKEGLLTHRTRLAIICLGLFCALRKGEMLRLQWSDVDFAKGIIRVRHSLSLYDGLKGPKTKAGVRDVPMPAPIRYALLELVAYWQTRRAVEEGCDEDITINARKLRLWYRMTREGRAERQRPLVADLSGPMPAGYVLCTTKRKPIALGCVTKFYLHPILRAAGVWRDGEKPYQSTRFDTRQSVSSSARICRRCSSKP